MPFFRRPKAFLVVSLEPRLRQAAVWTLGATQGKGSALVLMIGGSDGIKSPWVYNTLERHHRVRVENKHSSMTGWPAAEKGLLHSSVHSLSAQLPGLHISHFISDFMYCHLCKKHIGICGGSTQ